MYLNGSYFLILALRVCGDHELVLDTILQLNSLHILAVRYDDVSLKKQAVTCLSNSVRLYYGNKVVSD